jgi:hypothetical protein
LIVRPELDLSQRLALGLLSFSAACALCELAGFIGASFGCAAAPSGTVLIALRLLLAWPGPSRRSPHEGHPLQ